MRKPFESVGEIARWRLAYPMLRDADPGSLVTYEALGEVLTLKPKTDRAAIRVAVVRAAKELLSQDSRGVEAVPNQGYRVLLAIEHTRVARKHGGRASRSLGRGHSLVIHVDLNGVSAEYREEVQRMAHGLAVVREELYRERLVNHRRAQILTAAVVEVAGDVAAIDARLKRAEEALGIPPT